MWKLNQANKYTDKKIKPFKFEIENIAINGGFSDYVNNLATSYKKATYNTPKRNDFGVYGGNSQRLLINELLNGYYRIDLMSNLVPRKDDIFYHSINLKSNVDNNRVRLYTGNLFDEIYVGSKEEWHRISTIKKNENISSISHVYVYNDDFKVGDYVDFDTHLIINLTESFGKGNEPTVEVVETILGDLDKLWFDKKIEIFNGKDIYIDNLNNIVNINKIKDDVNNINEYLNIDDKQMNFTGERITGFIKNYDLTSVGVDGIDFNYETDDHENVYRLFDELVQENNQYIKRIEIGKSTNNLPIYSYEFKPIRPEIETKKLPTISIGSAIHGGENMSVSVLYYFFKKICGDWKNDEVLDYLRHNINFLVIPLQNPDDYNSKEYNGESNTGINLNRDWGYNWSSTQENGDSPFSRVESMAIRDYLKYNREIIIHHIDYHTRGGGTDLVKVLDELIIDYRTIPIKNENILYGNSILQLSKRIREKHPKIPYHNFYGKIISSIGNGISRSYIQNVIGISTTTLEAFFYSTTLNELNSSDVVNLNFDMLGQLIVDIVKHNQR